MPLRDTQQVSLRLPIHIIVWLDKEAKLKAEETGFKVTRSEVVRRLLILHKEEIDRQRADCAVGGARNEQ